MKCQIKEFFLSSSLRSKLWTTIILIILFSSIFNYWLTLFLYEHLYVEQTQQQLEEKGEQLIRWYTGGAITEEFKQKIKLVSSVSIEKVAIASHPDEISACLPVDDSIHSLLSDEKWKNLQNGQSISFIGEHKTFKRDMIVVAFPLIESESKQMVGGLFIYEPLATVTEAVSEIKILLGIYLAIFLFIGVVVAKVITNTMTRPLRQMESVTKKMMDGDFDAKVSVLSEDEIGKLGKTLNHLSDSLNKTIQLLSKEKNQLSQILDGIHDSVLTIYKQDKDVLCNGPAKNLFRKLGLNKEEFTRLPEIKRFIETVRSEKEVIIDEIELKNRQFVLYFGPLIDNEELWGIILVIHDVTAERQRESEAREFLAIVSHELRTPLSYVKGYTEALIDGVADSKELEDRYLTTIHNETERMERLVNDLLDLTQLERSTYPINQEKIRLDHIVEQIVKRYRPMYEKKGVALQSQLQKNLWMLGDEDRMIQILVNLLDNALRHTPEKGLVMIRAYYLNGDILLEVSDTGEGIDEENVTKIGNKFFRVDKARSRNNGGTGLGLAIVKQIIERLHGRMEVESVIAEGTTFRIYFPSYESE